MCQTVGKGVDLVQEGGKSVDGRAEEREDQGFASEDVLVTLIVGRDGIGVVDAQFDEHFLKEVPHVDKVFGGGDHRGGPSRGDPRGRKAEALRSIVSRHCSSLGVHRGCSSLRVLRGAAH